MCTSRTDIGRSVTSSTAQRRLHPRGDRTTVSGEGPIALELDSTAGGPVRFLETLPRVRASVSPFGASGARGLSNSYGRGISRTTGIATGLVDLLPGTKNPIPYSVEYWDLFELSVQPRGPRSRRGPVLQRGVRPSGARLPQENRDVHRAYGRCPSV